MIDNVKHFQRNICDLSRRIKATRGEHVASKELRGQAGALVDFYFRVLRNLFSEARTPESILSGCDACMHELLEASHGRTPKQSYLASLGKLDPFLLSLEKYALMVPATVRRRVIYDELDVNIIHNVRQILPTSANAYEQAIRDLSTESRLSWRGPATDLRESLRELLDHLAPDKQVVSQQGFKLEPNAVGPTMRQKVRFILKQRDKGSAAIETSETNTDSIEATFSGFVRSVYRRSNVSTHTATEKDEVLKILAHVRLVMIEILSIQREQQTGGPQAT